MSQEIDYEILTWEDVHLSERALKLFKELSFVLKYLQD